MLFILDNWYHKDYLEKKMREIDEKILNHMKIEITEKISTDMKEKSKKEESNKNGFVVHTKRWMVERTNMLGYISVEYYGRIANENYLLQKLKSDYVLLDWY